MANYVDGSVVISIDADLKKFESKIKTVASVAGAGLAAIGGAVGLIAKTSADAGISFESAFAGVIKTVDATSEELVKFRGEIRQMAKDAPTTANEIAGIAEAAGQLGIENKNLMSFTKTMADLGVATDMQSQQAATTLAQFANITKMNQENFSNLGSTIVALGNKMATTESKIADMAQNMASAGTQAGMTESEILGMAAALSSVGIEAQAGGSSFSRLISSMQLAVETGNEDLANFAKVANKTSDEFKKAFRENATDALMAFIKGLGDTERLGASATKVLDDMGITEIRLTNLLKSGANASDLFYKAIDTANTAWKENTALTEEANKRYETTESKLQIMKNKMTDFGIALFDTFKDSLVESIDTTSSAFDDLSNSLDAGELGDAVKSLGQDISNLTSAGVKLGKDVLPAMIKSLSWILKNGKPIGFVVGAIVTANTTLKFAKTAETIGEIVKQTKALGTIGSLSFKTMTATISGTQKSISLANIAVGVFTGQIKIATLAQAAFNAVSPVGWITLAVGALGLLTAGLVIFGRKNDEVLKKQKAMSDQLKSSVDSIKEQQKAYEDQTAVVLAQADMADYYKQKLLENIDAEGKIVGSKEEVAKAVDWLNTNMGTSIQYLNDERIAMDDNVKKLEEYLKAKQTQAIIDANYQGYQDYLAKSEDLYNQLLEKQSKLNDAKKLQNEYTKASAEYWSDYARAMDEGISPNQKLKDNLDAITTKLQEIGLPTGAKDLSTWIETQSTDVETLKEGISSMKEAYDIVAAGQEALVTKDFDSFDKLLENFDGIKKFNETASLDNAKQQVADLAAQSEKAQEKLQTFKDMYASGDIDWDQSMFNKLKKGVQDSKEELEKAKEKLRELEDVNSESQDNMSEKITTTTDTTTASYEEKWQTASANMKNDLASKTNAALGDVSAKVSSFVPPTIEIPVRYKYINSLSTGYAGGGGASYLSMDGASFDSGTFRHISASAASFVRPMTIPISRGQGSSDVSKVINQVNNFNEPWKSPADVSRELVRVSQDLVKG